jgi:hypothetical protein
MVTAATAQLIKNIITIGDNDIELSIEFVGAQYYSLVSTLAVATGSRG